MNIEELDVALDELENRLDRLRSLYEQYFLGIEKIEPSVARKDVDRRFWILRRVKIRNTARRFRMQVLIQRYNTFQQYWARICREIENGTYVRHLLKAKKNLGEEPKTWAAKKRLGLLRKDAGAGEEPDTNGASHDDGSDLGALLESGADLAAEAERAGQAALESAMAAPKRPAPPAAAKPTGPAAAKPAGPFTLDDLGPLDLDFEDEPPPAPKVTAPAARPAAPPAAARAPSPVLASPAPVASVAARPAAPVAVARPAGASPVAGAAAPAGARPPAPSAQGAAAARASAALAAGLASAGAVPAARAPGAEAPPTAGARPAAPSAAARPATAGPAGARPPAPSAAGAASPVAAARAPAPSPGGGLTDDRVKALHAELVAARRNLKQTESVSVESLAKTLRDAEQKLRAQHQGKSVDFQVVVKDGKPVVKPVVRK